MPADIFAGTKFTRHKLKDIHVWGERVRFCAAKIRSSYPNYTPTAASSSPAAAPLVDISPPDPSPDPTNASSTTPVIPQNPTPSSSPLGLLIWRITHANRGAWNNTIYQYKVFYSSILDPSLSYQYDIITYHAAIETELKTSLINRTNLCSYAAINKNNPDNPSWNEDMHRNKSEYYIADMNKEIAQLVKQKT